MIELTEGPIDVAAVLEHVTDPNCGAEVLFLGTTRQFTEVQDLSSASESETSPPRETSHLVYSCYKEMATKKLEELETEARSRWPVRRIAIVHRLGQVDPTESSVAVAVSTPHRSEAFEAARWLIDTLKHEVPIWKKEHYVQNGAEWIHPTDGNCRCVTPSPQQRPLTESQHSQAEQAQQ